MTLSTEVSDEVTGQVVRHLIEPQALFERIETKKALDNLIIVDLGQAQLYDRLHIPGAVHMPYGRLTSGIRPATGKLPELSQIQALLASIGYSPEKEIVVYDDEGGGWAGRFIWTLDLIGYQRASYLNGGIHHWLYHKLPVAKGGDAADQIQQSSEVDIAIKNSDLDVEKAYLQSRLGQEDLVVWDARSPEEFSGERCFAQQAGHIPGAVNYEWTKPMDRQKGLALRALNEIESELAALGITKEKEVITHCQTHHRSGFTYLLGKILGFPKIKAYSGSWSEWGNDLDLPVEVGS